MKTATLIASLLFSAAFAAEPQVPIKDKAQAWLDKAKSYIPSGTPAVLNPLNAGAAAIAALKVQRVNIRNYQRLLSPKVEGEEEWIIYSTGGNKSCFGRCAGSDRAWNDSVPLLSALPQPAGAPKLHLGKIDCEVEGPLCAALATGCPSVYHFIVPQASSGAVQTPARYVELNVSTITAGDFVKMASQAPNSNIMETAPYDGVFHPVDGFFAKAGILSYLGYAINFMGTTPSWLIMIGISFFSRQFMSRRVNSRPSIYDTQRAAAAAAAQPAPPAPAAKPATPGSAGKGGKKRK